MPSVPSATQGERKGFLERGTVNIVMAESVRCGHKLTQPYINAYNHDIFFTHHC